MAEFVKIGGYQVKNLLAQRVKFLYLDLRIDARETHPLLQTSRSVRARDGAALLNYLESEKTAKDAAIVLICENGAKSMSLAKILADNSYINVFVIEGGVEALANATSP